jgi:hypothetical protein
MDYGYVTPFISLAAIVLLIITLLLAALAFYNLKEIRKDLKNFLDVEKEWRADAALERERLADVLSAERKREWMLFLLHTHNDKGIVILPHLGEI